MKRIKILFSILIILATYSCSLFSQDDLETKLLAQFHKITSEEMMRWMEKLCSAEYKGRLTGTPEFIASAEWIADKLKEWGIKPAGTDGSYFQWFDQPYTVVNDFGSVSLKITHFEEATDQYGK